MSKFNLTQEMSDLCTKTLTAIKTNNCLSDTELLNVSDKQGYTLYCGDDATGYIGITVKYKPTFLKKNLRVIKS